MDKMQKLRGDLGVFYHFERQRLNHLFMNAVRYPFVMVCAGAGYGKTTAVHDFTEKYRATTAWMQISERDNVGGRFWENFSHTVAHISVDFAKEITKLGFPDTADKTKRFLVLLNEKVKMLHWIIVMDDFHLIENTGVIRFVENAFLNLPPGTSLFLISRSTPSLNTAGLVSRDQMRNVTESDLQFTDSELSQYFKNLDIAIRPESLREIMQDTGGWAFAINLIARSYQTAPGYSGYLRSAMKNNIFRLMEAEIWDGISESLQIFLVRLSLIDHLSVDLIILLAAGNEDMLTELERQTAYIRRDSYINAYLIHPLFLEFLRQKENMLSPELKSETFSIAGNWCISNGFRIDAMSYYEKIGDYISIAKMFIGSRSQIPYDIACYAEAVFERTPPDVFDTVIYLASTHMRTVMSQGHWDDAIRLAEYYEERYLKLSIDEEFRKRTLSSIYYCWNMTRSLMCLSDDIYDFDIYSEKIDKFLSEPFDPGKLINRNPSGAWVCNVGSSRKGAPDEFIAALKRSTAFLAHCYIGYESGRDELVCGELLFYKNEIDAAEAYFARSLGIAQERKKFGIMHRSFFYMLRIAVLRGNYARAEQALKDMRANLDKTEYYNRYIDYDITLCWYYCVLGLYEKAPDWLKENFSIYVHACFIENFANQMKAHYCYMTRNFSPLLSHIAEMKRRESFLFERVELTAMEACVHYKMKDREKSFSAFREAYENAYPNNILMPFIELGKDMRTLASSALKEKIAGIPESWLENIMRKAASYAKYQGHIALEYKKANGIMDNISITPRESDILSDLAHGFSRVEIAANRNLSINTVKMIINNVYGKFGAENLADLIRIAAELKMV